MSNPVINERGDRFWYNDKKQLHRLDGPAVKLINGDQYWYQNSKCHRLDGPAIEYADGHKAWYKNGNIHRTDGPAIECANGRKYWFIDDKPLTEEEFYRQKPIETIRLEPVVNRFTALMDEE